MPYPPHACTTTHTKNVTKHLLIVKWRVGKVECLMRGMLSSLAHRKLIPRTNHTQNKNLSGTSKFPGILKYMLLLHWILLSSGVSGKCLKGRSLDSWFLAPALAHLIPSQVPRPSEFGNLATWCQGRVETCERPSLMRGCSALAPPSNQGQVQDRLGQKLNNQDSGNVEWLLLGQRERFASTVEWPNQSRLMSNNFLQMIVLHKMWRNAANARQGKPNLIITVRFPQILGCAWEFWWREFTSRTGQNTNGWMLDSDLLCLFIIHFSRSARQVKCYKIWLVLSSKLISLQDHHKQGHYRNGWIFDEGKALGS